MSSDPAVTDPHLYQVLLENERVRVLVYRDRVGDQTHPHRHPDSVMVTLSAFRRRVRADGREVDVELPAGEVRWLGAQEHRGENTGTTETHCIFVELKEAAASTMDPAPDTTLGPTGP
jgi:hypothetical protein